MSNRKRSKSTFGNPLGLKSETPRPLPKSSKAIRRSKRNFWSRIPFLRRRKFNFTWKKLGVSLVIVCGVFIIGATGVFAYYVRDLPNPKKITDQPVNQSTQIFDRTGKPLYNIHGEENRTVVKNEEISDYLKKATIAVEDANFYNHQGFSLRGIGRAVFVRLHLLKDRQAGGGSTITQQYIKRALIKDSSQTLDRKLKELILAIEVEQMYSKDEILTGYLNEISYGTNAYGIEAASQTYFNKPAKELTLSESATLAAIPQLPTYYSPYGNHVDDLFERKEYILNRMAKVGFITQEEADKAKSEGPNATIVTFRKQSDLIAPHFVFYVREKLVEILGPDPQLAQEKLDTGGYRVTTSLDLDTQNLAQKIVSEMGPEAVKKYKASNAALTAIDPKTGEILAMVGSIDYEDSKSGNTNFADALLQPGSSFKPIVYATAFGPDYKYAPGTITYDVPTDFGNYKPNNYDLKTHGAISNRQALAGSLNIPAVKNLALVGVKNAITTAQNLGISTLTRDPNDYGLSIVLGSGEVKPVEIAGAYASFANEGMNNPLRPILTIEKEGQIVQDFRTAEAKKAVEPEVAYQVSSILSDNIARSYVFGTKNNLVLPDRPVAAKSGTTENNRDAWTIGYTPQIAVAVWVGNNEPKQTMTKGADGSYVAAPIWNRFMREYLTGKPVENFKRPDTIKDITIDKLSGKLPTDQSPTNERLTDIFAPWQVPKDSDDIHIEVRIAKASGKLATELTPADQTEERIYFTIHSERPTNPAWEEPVQAWARSAYGDRVGSPPTEKDDVYTESNKPTVALLSPANGATVNGTFTIEASPGGSRPITKVEFLVNNVSIGSVLNAPWSITYDSANFQPGTQIIQAVATNDLGLTSTAQVTVTPAGSPGSDSSPPAPVLNAKASNGKFITPTTPMRLTWNNPSTSDLAYVYVYQSNDPNLLGSRVQTVLASPDTLGTAEVTAAVGKYYFTLRTTDTSGNENQTGTKVQAQVTP